MRINRKHMLKLFKYIKEEKLSLLLKTFIGINKEIEDKLELKDVKKGLKILDFIGIKIKVINSSSTFKGKEGIVIWETRNTFKILTLHKKRERIRIIDVPKYGNVFELSLKGERFIIRGDEIRFSPIERAKRLRKWKA